MSVIRTMAAAGLFALLTSPALGQETGGENGENGESEEEDRRENRGEDGSWYLKPYFGASLLSDTSGRFVQQPVEVSTDTGFVSGLGIGYRSSPFWSTEIAWEYRGNDSKIDAGGGAIHGGDSHASNNASNNVSNYASSIFYLNGYYHFPFGRRFTPYLGAGLGWVQEIDIDLQGPGSNRSYSGDGDIALQTMLGVNYLLSERWSLDFEARYSRMSGFDLKDESGSLGKITGFDYKPVSLSLGLVYRF